jgi:hypothetical protein
VRTAFHQWPVNPILTNGGMCAAGDQYDKTQLFGQIHGSPVVWTQVPGSQYRIYVQGKWDFLRAFQYSNGFFVGPDNQPLPCAPATLLATPIDQSSDAPLTITGPCGALSLSSNNGQAGSAILWVSTPADNGNGDAENAKDTTHTGLLRAYDPLNLKNKLFEQPLDPGGFVKFVPPTVANGNVYTAEIGKIRVFGIAPPSCTTSFSCPIHFHQPPNFTVQCAEGVIFYETFPGSPNFFLQTDTTVAGETVDVNNSILACYPGTKNCTSF